jgi:hypothetical protein
MTKLTNSFKHAGCYLGESNALNQINEEIVLLSGSGVVDPGTVLGQVGEGGAVTVTGSAKAGNTGNGALGTVTADAGADPGTYKITIIEPGTNTGTFRVEKPDGTEDGTGVVGTAYNGTINFTLADGSADFVAGDGFSVNVSYASSTKYAPWDPAGNDGRENAAAILYDRIDATAADKGAVATVRGPATISQPYLTFKTGATDPQIAAAVAQLKAKGMIVLDS